jgi:hypothetical protein
MVPSQHFASLQDPEQCPQRSLQWYKERSLRLTASEVPAVLGKCPYTTTAVFRRDKLAQLVQPASSSSSTTAAQQNGIDSEDTGIQVFLDSAAAAQLDVVKVRKAGLFVTGSGWLGASPDAILELADGRKVLLEVKCRAEDPGELPVDVNLQVGAVQCSAVQ